MKHLTLALLLALTACATPENEGYEIDAYEQCTIIDQKPDAECDKIMEEV